mgnify:CR=1 FL=1
MAAPRAEWTWHDQPQAKTVNGQALLVLAEHPDMALCVRADEWELLAQTTLASTGLVVVRRELLT